MTPEEKFQFDLQGYLVVKDVLSARELEELSSEADRRYPDSNPKNKYTDGPVSTWGKPFQNLMDHPKVVPYLIDLIGPYFRLDHDYCIFMREGGGNLNLHGGEGHEGDHWYKYRDGVMKNGLTVFAYNLTPVNAGDGGFVCIPGSHKSNFIDDIPKEVVKFERPANYVVQPEAGAGDLVIFTESLVHGTHAWKGRHERRSLLYKFSPGHSSWSKNYPDSAQYVDLTERQRRILLPPSIGARPKVL